MSRAVDCIETLRAEIRSLSRALAEKSSPAQDPSAAPPAAGAGPDALITRLTEENERLRAERKLALDQVRLLIKEVEKAV